MLPKSINRFILNYNSLFSKISFIFSLSIKSHMSTYKNVFEIQTAIEIKIVFQMLS